MRVLMFNHNIAGSGTFLRAAAFARQLATQGDIVTLVTISPRSRLRHTSSTVEGVEIVETPDLMWGIGRTGWDPWDVLYRWILSSNTRVDVVHAFDSRPAVVIPALRAAKAAGAPLVMDWADWWGRGGTIAERGHGLVQHIFGGVETYFEEHFRSRAAATTVISNALGLRAAALGVPSDTITRIPNGCEPHRTSRFDVAQARQRLGLPPGPLVGYVGVLLTRDATLLADAFADVASRDPAAKLVLIGRHKAGLPDRALTTGKVIETGSVSDEDLALWVSACDVMALPLTDSIANRGRWPGKGSVYLESGKPVVSTRVGDFADYVDRYRAGVVTDPEPESLAAGLLHALGASSELETWGANARNLAEGPLSITELSATLKRVYLVAAS